MYARIARFTGGDPSRIDEQLAEMKEQMDAGRAGATPADAPDEVRTLSETVRRVLVLVDRGSGASVGITFCDSEEDMKRADEALNRMSPGEGGGTRTSVEIYEVGLDEDFG